MEKDTENKIREAFGNDQYEWRTIRGVAKEINVNREIVLAYISLHGDEIVKSSSFNSNGEQLFTTRDKYKKQTGIGTRLSSVMRNRGA